MFEFILIVEELFDWCLRESKISSCREDEGFNLLKQVFIKHYLRDINELKDLHEVRFCYSVSASYHNLVGIQKLSFFLMQGNLYRIELFNNRAGLLARNRFEPMIQMIEKLVIYFDLSFVNQRPLEFLTLKLSLHSMLISHHGLLLRPLPLSTFRFSSLPIAAILIFKHGLGQTLTFGRDLLLRRSLLPNHIELVPHQDGAVILESF